MKRIIVFLIIMFGFGSIFAESHYCLDNAPAFAGSIVLGAVITFLIVLIFSKILPKKNKSASCFTNILIFILWLVLSYLVCFLFRTFLY